MECRAQRSASMVQTMHQMMGWCEPLGTARTWASPPASRTARAPASCASLALGSRCGDLPTAVLLHVYTCTSDWFGTGWDHIEHSGFAGPAGKCEN